jgi:cytidine deaminase
MTTKSLLEVAKTARLNSYSPYSKFAVGAAIRTDAGIFSGCNIESSSYGLTLCAERVAIFKALSEGAKKITEMAVVADTDGPVAPCGACRQIIHEFAPGARIIMANLKGDSKIQTATELLPDAFDSRSLPGDDI